MSQFAPAIVSASTAGSFFDRTIGWSFNAFGRDNDASRTQDNTAQQKDADTGSSKTDSLDYKRRVLSLNRETLLEFFQKRGLHHVSHQCVDFFVTNGRLPPKSEIEKFEHEAKQKQERQLQMKQEPKPRAPAPRTSFMG
jgi:hypothetical protein